MRIKELKENDQTILFYEIETIKDDEYLFTLRQTEDGRFISDDSVLELWVKTLKEKSWVNPNLDFKYALEVYDRKDGYFTSIAPVILCDGKDIVTKEEVEKLFEDVKDSIERELERPNLYAQEFGKILRTNGFDRQVIGGGCSIKI